MQKEIAQNGIERTVTELIFFFLDKVGILWQTNRIFPAQEHIVSNIIRQKIVRAIDGLPFVERQHPLCLLFLPEDEHHEMGLLFVYYLLRRNNIPVIYLGANVPLKDIGHILPIKSPSYLYLHLTTFPRQHNFQKYLSLLSKQAAGKQILISGSATQTYRKALPENVRFLTSFPEVISYVSSIN